LVTWVRSWRAGLVPYDEVAPEVAGEEEQLVADAPGTWTDVPLGEGLTLFSKLHPDEIRLVLPAPGDPRGLPGPGAFSGAALVAEECLIAGAHGLVPEVRRHTSGSGDEFETVLWRVYPVPAAAPTAPAGDTGPAEAEAELSQAVMESTRALARLDVARWRPELAGALATLRRPDFAGDLPPGYDARARRLFARASVLDRVLVLAGEDAPGAAVNSFEAQQRDAALRPLLSACRRALVAACNAPLSA
jgi:hypothetical protein